MGAAYPLEVLARPRRTYALSTEVLIGGNWVPVVGAPRMPKTNVIAIIFLAAMLYVAYGMFGAGV